MPSPLDNPVDNSGFQILTCRKGSRYAETNISGLYQRTKKVGNKVIGPISPAIKNEIIGLEPVYTLENENSYMDEDQKLEPPVLSALNGLPANSAKAVDRIIRWLGFARDETANEHVPGNVNGGIVVIAQGVLTVMHSGVRTISAGALVCLRAPTEDEAAMQIFTGRSQGKAIGLLEEYKPHLDSMDAYNGFMSIMRDLMLALKQPIQPRAERELSEDQSEAFGLWWRSQRMIILVGYATIELASVGGTVNDKSRTDMKKLASVLGLIGKETTAESLQFQVELLQRVFVRKIFSGGVADDDDAGQLFFDLENSMNADRDPDDLDMARMQKSAVENNFNAIIGGHSRRITSIIGRTSTGGKPGGSIDIAFKGTSGP